MNQPSALFVVGSALALASAGCREAHADPNHDPRPGYGAAGDAGPTEEPEAPPAEQDAGTKPWLAACSTPFPEGSSPAPTAAEWLAATPAPEARVTDPHCTVTRVREWYRASCDFTRWAERVTGTREGMTFGCKRKDPTTSGCDEAWVVFPAHRGDQRAVELFRWGKWGPQPDALVTEQFVEGDPCPVVSLQGIRWEF